MNTLEFIASLVNSLAWPAAVVIGVVLVRKPLLRMLPQLEELQYKDWKARFRRELDAAAETAQSLPPAAPGEEPQLPGFLGGGNGPTMPRNEFLVLAHWGELERMMYELAAKAGFAQPYGPHVVKIEDHLRSHGLISEEAHALLEHLRALRNQAAHPGPTLLSLAEASAYASLSATARNYLSTQIRNRSS